jgi:hypothetical protein
MSSAKKWLTGIVAAISFVYMFTKNMQFMKPVVTWLDKRIGGDTLIELLLGSLVLYLLLTHGEKEAAGPAEPQTQLPSQSPVQTVSSIISPIIDVSQHHHYPEGNRKEPLSPPTPIRRRKPSIVGKKARIAWLSNRGDSYCEPLDNGEFKAVIAEFRNEPGEFSLITWYHVRASIVYFDEYGDEVADVGSAEWLEPSSLILDMPSHVTCKLIVAMLGDCWLVFNGQGSTIIPDDVKRAKIILHDDREFFLSFFLDVDLSSGAVGSLVSAPSPQ